MNSKNTDLQVIVDEYIHQIEEKLPIWLSEDTKEKQSVLDELEEHVWDKAEDIAQGPLYDEHIYSAIKMMGTPEAITREYRKRGTPHVFISEEWWPIYKKVFFGIGTAFILAVLVSVVYKLIQEGFGLSAFESILGFWSAYVTLVLLITAIFTGLSWEGILPTDMKDEAKNHRERYYYSEEGKKEKNDGKHRKRNYINLKEKLPLNLKDLLSSGIWGIIWGILFIIQPIQGINDNFTSAFLAIMVIYGVLSVCESFIKLGHVFTGIQRINTQRLLLILRCVAIFFQIFIALDMLADPMALKIFSSTFKYGWDATTVATWILWISIVATSIEMLTLIVKAFSYRYCLNNYNELKAKTSFE